MSSTLKFFKHKIVLLALLITGGDLSAQKGEYVRQIIEYKLSHIIDSTQPGNPYQRNFMLLVGNNTSLYDVSEIIMEITGRPGGSSQSSNQGTGNFKSFATRNSFMMDFSVKKMFTDASILNTTYEVEEPIPVIDWVILPEQKKVNSYMCQKAVGYCLGRNYTAWFTADIPSKAGPWKLSGLPGLILEAYDTSREVIFQCTSIYPGFDGAKVLMPLKEVVKISPQKYKKLKAAIEKDPNSLNAAGGNLGNLVASNVRAGSPVPVASKPRKINNPIEKQ